MFTPQLHFSRCGTFGILAGFGSRLFPRFSVEPLRMNLREFRYDAIGGHASAKERVSATPPVSVAIPLAFLIPWTDCTACMP